MANEYGSPIINHCKKRWSIRYAYKR